VGDSLLDITLFGPCVIRKPGAGGYEITRTKHKALFALLATAPYGRRTRSFVQDALWGQSAFDSGQQSLRRAIADIKKIIGPDFDELITSAHSEIALNLSHVRFVGRPGAGDFLEGLDVAEEGFEDWLRSIRSNPSQIYSLYSAALQPPPPSILPTVAVIPFHLVWGDPSMAAAGDWLAEEVCRSLSKSSLMSVISHLSTRQLNYAQVSMPIVKQLLGADYCLVGSLRLENAFAVLSADFVDTSTGRILWTREFKDSLKSLLSSESDAITSLTNSVGRMIAADSLKRVTGRDLADVEDHSVLLAGVSLLHELRFSSFAKSRELLEYAAKRAPRAPEPLAWLSEWHLMSVWNGYSVDVKSDANIAVECAHRALELEPENSLSLAIDGVINSALHGNQDVAGKQFATALEYNPNHSISWLFSGAMHAFRDDGKRAIESVERARALSPLDPMSYLYDSFAAYAHISDGNYARAVELADKSLEQNPWHVSTLRTKICAHHHLDQGDQVRMTARTLRERHPEFDLDTYVREHPATGYVVGAHMVEALRAAGF